MSAVRDGRGRGERCHPLVACHVRQPITALRLLGESTAVVAGVSGSIVLPRICTGVLGLFEGGTFDPIKL